MVEMARGFEGFWLEMLKWPGKRQDSRLIVGAIWRWTKKSRNAFVEMAGLFEGVL
jgi:hypothetical protein